jgi:hypothetical protein
MTQLNALRDPSKRVGSLFRYRSLDRLDYLRSILFEHRVYASLIGDGGFNDPCELFYSVDFNWDEVEARRLIRYMKEIPRASASQARVSKIIIETGEIDPREVSMANDMFASATEDELLDRMRRNAGNIPANLRESFKASQRAIDQKTVGVCSMSELGDSPFMSWNYADHHRGVCLEFSTESKPFRCAVPVNYTDAPPIYSSFSPPYLQQNARMQTKGRAWSEEKEWRIFGHPDTGLAIPFDPAALLSISLCNLIDPKDAFEVLQMIAQRNEKYGPIKVYRFTPNRTAYVYDRVPVDLSNQGRSQSGTTRQPDKAPVVNTNPTVSVGTIMAGRLIITILGICGALMTASIVGSYFSSLETLTLGVLIASCLFYNFAKARNEIALMRGRR